MDTASPGHEGFDRRKDFFEAFDLLLAGADDAQGEASLNKLTMILDGYQEQPYLLDPFLDRTVEPVARLLRHDFEQLVRGQGSSKISLVKIARLCRLLYYLTKVRGYKTIVRFFPHQVADLEVLLSVFSTSGDGPQRPAVLSAWETRYTLLLWLSLVCMMPFALDRFDYEASIGTARGRLQANAMEYLSEPGKEREAAALVLARLILRQDTLPSDFSAVLDQFAGLLRKEDAPPSVFLTAGILQTLAEIVKLGRRYQLLPVVPQLYRFLALADASLVGPRNIGIRKLRAKLAGRLATLLLSGSESVAEVNVPEEVEVIVQDLLEALKDKDTVVRWSAAKHLARVCTKLPETFTSQICQAVLDLFSIDVLDDTPQRAGRGSGQQLDLLAVSDNTWHGACLACAEILRRALFPLDLIPELITWTLHALHFEQRKGVQTIGSGVRDAAAYILWSLGRAVPAETVKGRAQELATSLMTAALFDREVHIRRAASAAYQEIVGRLGVFPHGIEVLRMADFFTVGLKRSAYLTAAPNVARFPEYEPALLHYLKTVCLSHWDTEIRELAAQSVRAIAANNVDIQPTLIYELIAFFDGLSALSSAKQQVDTRKMHGYLLALAELASLRQDRGSAAEQQILAHVFAVVAAIPDAAVKAYSSDTILISASKVLQHSFTDAFSARLPSPPPWERILDYALRRPSDELHEGLRKAMQVVTASGAGRADVERLLKSLQSGTSTAQQAAACILGGCSFRSKQLRPLFKPIVTRLRGVIGPEATVTIETKRNASSSLAEIITSLSAAERKSLLTPSDFAGLITGIALGLDNYASDQRGDVGSWVRGAALISLSRSIVGIADVASDDAERLSYLPWTLAADVLGKMLKQTLDRIDSLRETAWSATSEIIGVVRREVGNARILDSLASSFDDTYREHWRDLSWTFPRSLALLELGRGNTLKWSNDSLIEGFVLLLGGKGNSETRKAAEVAAVFFSQLGTSDPSFLGDFVSRITIIAETRVKEPKVVLMALETLASLLEEGGLDGLRGAPGGTDILRRILAVAMRGLTKPKPMLRLSVAMRIVVFLTGFPTVRTDTLPHLGFFFANDMPRMRSLTAETLYTQLQTAEGDLPEDCEAALLETDWVGEEGEARQIAMERITQALWDAWSQ